MSEKFTAQQVAQWMLSKFNEEDYLSQSEAYYDIMEEFGAQFVLQKENGSYGISPAVLKAFRSMTDDDVVWSRSALAWRRREDYDGPGRMQP